MGNVISNLDIIIGLIIIIAMVIFGLLTKIRNDDESYFLASREITTLYLSGTMAAGVVGGGVLLVFSGYAYQYGYSALSIFLGTSTGLFLLPIYAKRYKIIADTNLLYSFPDLFLLKWGKSASTLSSIVIFLWASGFIIMQLIAAGDLLRILVPLSYNTCVILSATAVLLYIIPKGYKAVVKTDLIQYSATIFFFLILAIIVLPHVNYEKALTHFESTKIEDVFGFFFLGLLNIIVSADLWQRIYSAKNMRTAKYGTYFAAVLVLILGIVLLIVMIDIRGLPETFKPKLAIAEGLTYILPKGVIGLAFAALLSAILSTLDTMLFILGLTISNDISIKIIPISLNKKLVAKIGMFLIALMGVIAAIIWPNLLQFGLALSSLGLCLTPTVLFNFRGLSKEAVIGSLIGGLMTFLILLFSGEFTPVNAVYTFPVAVFGLFIGYLYRKLKKK